MVVAVAEPEPEPDTGPGPAVPVVDAALPPWLWLTLCTLALGALLFVSFRRNKSAELYSRARDAVRHRVTALTRAFRRRGRVHLSDPEAELGSQRSSRFRPRSASQASDQSSLSTSSGRSPLSTPRPGNDDADGDEEEEEEEDDDDDDDASPFARTSSPLSASSSSAFRTRRDYALDTAPLRPLVSGVLSTLGWTATRATSALTGHGEKSDAFARMFWGLRDTERTGAIRLGRTAAPATTTTTAAAAAAAAAARPRAEPSPTGKAARVLGHSSHSDGATPRKASPAQPFRLGEEEEDNDDDDDDVVVGESTAVTDQRERDAVELPDRFSLGPEGPPPA